MNNQEHSLTSRYLRQQHQKVSCLILAIVLLIIIAGAACCLGATDLTPGRIAASFIPPLRGMIKAQPLTNKEINVLIMLRLPRVVAGVVAGAGLGIAGSSMQAITGNQMASPFTTGISGAAAFGAALVIVFFNVTVTSVKILTVISAFVMALLCEALVYCIASYRGLQAEALVLTGIAMNYLFSAMNSTMQYVANENQLPAIIHWTFGSLNDVGWENILIMACFLAISFPIFQSNSRALNLLESGDDESAKAMGVNVKRTRLSCGIVITFLTASIVSFTGIIGFVGLVAPHIARLMFGGNYKYLLSFSAVIGAILVVAADTIGRVAFSPTTLPVGIIVSYVGVPLFIYLILRERKMY